MVFYAVDLIQFNNHFRRCLPIYKTVSETKDPELLVIAKVGEASNKTPEWSHLRETAV